MSKRKKKTLSTPVVYSDISQKYFNLWVNLSNCHDEPEFDSVRKQMNEVWTQMNKQDKKDFQICSCDFERRHKTNSF